MKAQHTAWPTQEIAHAASQRRSTLQALAEGIRVAVRQARAQRDMATAEDLISILEFMDREAAMEPRDAPAYHMH